MTDRLGAIGLRLRLAAGGGAVALTAILLLSFVFDQDHPPDGATLLLWACAIGGFAAAATWFIGDAVTRPLVRLSRAADQLLMGNAAMIVPESGFYPEARHLARTLGRLVEREANQRDALNRLNASLERNVDERTAALAAANAQLQHEIEERRRAERERELLIIQLSALCETDPLTRALNRRGLAKLAEREIQRAQRDGRPLAVVLFDLDQFKTINDTYGHAAGDEVLSAVAAICSRTIREIDLLARFGGEEFIILLTDATDELASDVADRLRRAISEADIVTAQGRLRVTASFGVAPVPADATDLSSAIARADQALYEAKRAGRDRVRTCSGPPALTARPRSAA